MVGIVGIIAVLVVLGLSLVITRLATVALAMTGLSRQMARFQARSAFTGTGFTTSEAEKVVNHPLRRRIIMMLMIVRSAGIVTIIVSLILSFVGTEAQGTKLVRLLWLLGGVAVLWALSVSRWVDRGLSRVMRWALNRWTDLDVRDYVGLLHLSGEYLVREMQVQEGDWLEGRPLRECELDREGIAVLGIVRRDGNYVGAPKADTEVEAGDTVILYGREGVLHQLDERQAGAGGDREHAEAVDAQQRLESREQREDKQRQREQSDEDKSAA